MPKLSKDFETTLNFGEKLEVKQELIAAGYLLQSKGEYAGAARRFLRDGYRRWLAGLSERERKDFEEILRNVRLTVTA